MAKITSIQVANFLSDGYRAGKEWVPLYRGETFRLFGRSAALQIDNGGGKTSLTEACLYLLSRDRRLKQRVADRIAPIEHGWTHIRIEFVEPTPGENLLQRDLITEHPEDVPGVSYVIGLAWSRGQPHHFYYYQGLLQDAPCFHQEPARLQLVDNDTFKKSVERMPGARWDKWPNQQTWFEEIRQLANIEVIKQNVEFQLEGAGDYSAMMNKVKQGAGESYDEAFFRMFVAPELLRNPLGQEGSVDEQQFEDTLLKSLRPTADAMVNISMKQRELTEATDALIKFEPVETKAQNVIEANNAYEGELAKVVRDGAVVHALAVKNPVPGIPKSSSGQPWSNERGLVEAISCLVITKREGVLITDEGLARLSGVETGRINEYARDRNLTAWGLDTEVIDLKGDLKVFGTSGSHPDNSGDKSEVIVSKGDLKVRGRGGRRFTTSAYELNDALALVDAIANLAGARTKHLPDLLRRAFGLAIDELDTNPYRKEGRELSKSLDVLVKQRNTAVTEHEHWSDQHEALLRETREAQENQVAYETFGSRLPEFLPEHKDSPLEAKDWATDQLMASKTAHGNHARTVADLTGGYLNWKKLKTAHQDGPLQQVLDSLIQHHEQALQRNNTSKAALEAARRQRGVVDGQHQAKSRELQALEGTRTHLAELANAMPKFREFFGDVDPDTLTPTRDLQQANKDSLANTRGMDGAIGRKEVLEELKSGANLFQEIFGAANASGLDPTKDLFDHQQRIEVENAIISDHQPFVEALAEFNEHHPDVSPDAWLVKTEERRGELSGQKATNLSRMADIQGELADLESYALADDRVYAKALTALTDHRIAFERLHVLIAAGAGDKGATLLTLFSAALSAPVVRSLEDADKATQVLEQAKLTVPVFLMEPLKEFINEGRYTLSGKLAHSFLVGRRTRQVEILLNPGLIEEEKVTLVTEKKELERLNGNIAARLNEIAQDSPSVVLAIKARSAIQRNSDAEYRKAISALDELSKALPALKRRASPDALACIATMKQFAAAGGQQALNTLLATTIPQLEAEQRRISREITRITPLVGEDAIRALHAAKDYKAAGGNSALARTEVAIATLEPAVEALMQQLAGLDIQISGTLSNALADAETLLSKLNETFALDQRDLADAIAFQTAGHAQFMDTADTLQATLSAAIDQAMARLQGIDFDRASRYIESTQDTGRSMADRLAEAEAKRKQAKSNIATAEVQMNNLNGRIGAIKPFAEGLHDAVAEIRRQYLKIASFSDDIRQRVATEGNLHPEILRFAEEIHLACMGKQTSTSAETRAAIGNLKESIRSLEIDTKQLLQFSKEKQRAQDDFRSRRDEFCEKARTGEIKGLQLPEIERIADARTIAQLAEIHQIKDKIEATITEHREKLQTYRETMESSKAAAVENFARFARQAKANLAILDSVMRKTPNARFFVEAEVAEQDRIQRIIESLIEEIQDRERAARERGAAALNDDIERRDRFYKELVHSEIYRNIFIAPRIYFTHAAIRNGEKEPFTDKGGLSAGQRTVLMMMWLIKQAEYALTCVALKSSTKREQTAALKGAQRIMFFDGLFSNLTNEDYINPGFQGVDENFQLIGLIHNPHYVNNTDIFPVHLVGKKKVAKKGNSQRVFMAIEPWQEDNGVLLYTSAYRDKATPEAGHA